MGRRGWPHAAWRVTARLFPLSLLLPVLSGCRTAVETAPLPQVEHPACHRAAELWPEQVIGLDRRETTPGDAHAGAWGEPAVIARCGAPAPDPTKDPCVDVNGVDWVMSDLTDGKRFVTYGREPAIEVLVPHVHEPEPMVLPKFTDAARALPATGRRCS